MATPTTELPDGHVLPEGWSAALLPSGALRINPRPRSIRQAVADLITGFCVVSGLMLLLFFTTVRRMLERDDRIGLALVGALATCASLYLLATFTRDAFATEEWLIEEGTLERHYSLAGFHWHSRLQKAGLRIERVERGTAVSERLVAISEGKVNGLTAAEMLNGSPDAHRVGAFLAKATGWPFEVP